MPREIDVKVSMANTLLRPAVGSDALKIRDLIHRVGINPMDLNWKHFIVAETPEGGFVGCAQLKPHKDKSLELASVAVEESFRGQGVAHALIEHLLAQSPRPVYLMCRPALGLFYEQFGFRVIGLNEMPPYFQRILRLLRVLVFLPGRERPLIMRLD
jgi:N-acetylglutamate synthase-like GNAT family acetyltransferase